nr:monooxygenase [uncultured bacterium]
MFSQLWIGYRGSRAVGRGVGQLKPGARAPYAPLGTGSVLDLTHGTGYHVLLFSVPQPEVVAARFDGRYAAAVTTHVISPSEEAAHRAYKVDGPRLVLVRPDGHVAAVADPGSVDTLIEFLDSVLTRVQAIR